MTCSQCNFQWCWVCEQECVAGHYLFGTCKGLHFSDVRKKGDAKNLLCHNCGLYCCFTYIIMKIVFLIIYLTMMPYFYLAVKILDYFDDKSLEDLYFIWFFYASFLPFFIPWFSSLLIPRLCPLILFLNSYSLLRLQYETYKNLELINTLQTTKGPLNTRFIYCSLSVCVVIIS
jgi:hypothetical protein